MPLLDDDCQWKNQSRRSNMGLTSQLSNAYDTISSSCFSFSSLLSPMTMSPTNLTIKVLGPYSLPVCAFLHVFELSVDRVK